MKINSFFSKVILIVICILIVLWMAISLFPFSCNQLNCFSMTNKNHFVLEKTLENTQKSSKGIYKDKNTFLIITTYAVSKLDADQYLNAAVNKIKGFYTDSLAAYPGVVSNKITCSDRYKPSFKTMTTKNGTNISYFLGYFNHEMEFGSCDAQNVPYKGIVGLFYCEKKTKAIQIELFTRKETFEKNAQQYKAMLESIGCE